MGFPVLEMVKKNVPEIFMDCHMMVSDPARVGFMLSQWRRTRT
jgi:pentose-5-phosphate-3-epimerase